MPVVDIDQKKVSANIKYMCNEKFYMVSKGGNKIEPLSAKKLKKLKKNKFSVSVSKQN